MSDLNKVLKDIETFFEDDYLDYTAHDLLCSKCFVFKPESCFNWFEQQKSIHLCKKCEREANDKRG